MDPKIRRRELLKAMRGSRSQSQMSQRFGSKFNIVYRWEAGRSKLSWPEFVNYCQICNVDLKRALEKSMRHLEDPHRSDLLVKRLAGPRGLNESAKFFKVSRFTLADWLSAKRTPSLDQVLNLMRVARIESDFIGELVDIGQVPSLKRARKNTQALRTFVENPEHFAAKLAFKLAGYENLKSHKDGFFAKSLGIRLSDEKQLLKELEEVGAIEWDGDKFHLLDSSDISTLADWDGHKKLVAHWAKRGLAIMDAQKTPESGQTFNFLIFPTNRKTREKLTEAYHEYFYKIRNLVMTDTDENEDVMVIVMQNFALGSQTQT